LIPECNMSSGAGTSYPAGSSEFIQIFIRVRVAQTWVFSVVFSGSLFVFLSLFIWPLHCLSFLDWRLLITSFLSSNDSIKHFDNHDNDLLPLTTMIENKFFVISFFADLQRK
jgi:hypothetical protein